MINLFMNDEVILQMLWICLSFWLYISWDGLLLSLLYFFSWGVSLYTDDSSSFMIKDYCWRKSINFVFQKQSMAYFRESLWENRLGMQSSSWRKKAYPAGSTSIIHFLHTQVSIDFWWHFIGCYRLFGHFYFPIYECLPFGGKYVWISSKCF